MTRSAVESELPGEARAAAAEAPALANDRALTRERDETKYVIHPLRISSLVRVLNAQLKTHRYTGEGANRLPDAQHYTSTVYFDGASRALFRAARENPTRNEKLRARALTTTCTVRWRSSPPRRISSYAKIRGCSWSSSSATRHAP